MNFDDEDFLQSWFEIYPHPLDEPLYENIKITLNTGESQSVEIYPTKSWVLYVKEINLPDYDNVKYEFIVAGETFQDYSSSVPRGSTLKFFKPKKVGEGDKIFVKVTNLTTSTLTFGIEIIGWARRTDIGGTVT